MHKPYALTDDDQMLDCPHARWYRIDNDRVDFAIPDFDACASVDKDPGNDYYAWSYFVSCAGKRSEVQGLYDSPNTCLGEATRWLQDFDCGCESVVGTGKEFWDETACLSG